MLICEILNWNNDPAEEVRPGPQPDLSSAPFNDDPTNLANAFTRRGLVKSFWNLNGSEEQPSGPAPPNPETELIPNGTMEPTTASWVAEPVEEEPPGESASARSVSAIARAGQPPTRQPGYHSDGRRRSERRHEVSGRPFETIGCPSCASASMMM
jgi:hypothetical protein